MSTALVLLEIQNDYFPNGRISLERSLEAAAKTQAVLQFYREKKRPIIHIQHISTHPDATYFLPCTKGAEFYSTVQPVKGEIIVKKHYPNSFKDTGLLNHLIKQQINHIILCGMMTQMSVDATVRAAYDLGFSCTVLQDCCAARQLEFNHTTIPAQSVHYSFLAALQSTYASVVTAEDFLQKTGARTAVATEVA